MVRCNAEMCMFSFDWFEHRLKNHQYRRAMDSLETFIKIAEHLTVEAVTYDTSPDKVILNYVSKEMI